MHSVCTTSLTAAFVATAYISAELATETDLDA